VTAMALPTPTTTSPLPLNLEPAGACPRCGAPIYQQWIPGRFLPQVHRLCNCFLPEAARP
jgi:hypothetical protein